MARHHAQLSTFVRRLRPSPQRFAAAAAVQDPNLLLQYQAAHVHEERPPSRRPRRPRRPIGDETSAALATGVGFTVSLLIASRAFDGALLDQAKVGILATALLAPALAVAALAPRGTAPATRPTATSPCAA